MVEGNRKLVQRSAFSINLFSVQRSALVWRSSFSVNTRMGHIIVLFEYFLLLSFAFRLLPSQCSRSHKKRPFCYFLWLGQKVEKKDWNCVAFKSFYRQYGNALNRICYF
jgi:hypothetical protein